VAALIVVLSPVTKLFLTVAVVFAIVFVDICDVTVDPSAFVVVTLTVVGIDVVSTTDVELSCLGVVEVVDVSWLPLVFGDVVDDDESPLFAGVVLDGVLLLPVPATCRLYSGMMPLGMS